MGYVMMNWSSLLIKQSKKKKRKEMLGKKQEQELDIKQIQEEIQSKKMKRVSTVWLINVSLV